MRHTIAVVLLLVTGACRTSHDPLAIPAIDLLKEFDRADRRPHEAFSLVNRDRPAIAAPAPGRIVWTMTLPRHGELRTAVAIEGAAPVRFRIGVSDERIYEQLQSVIVASPGTWTDVAVDLSAYAGWKWSLFYHPDFVAWHVALSTDAVQGTPGRALWGTPEIVTDRRGAIEYEKRRRTTRNAAP